MVTRTLTKRHKTPLSLKRASLEKTQISAPIALLSTTNILSYTSPALNLRTSTSANSLSSSSSSTHSRSPTLTSWDDESSGNSNSSSPIYSSHAPFATSPAVAVVPAIPNAVSRAPLARSNTSRSANSGHRPPQAASLGTRELRRANTNPRKGVHYSPSTTTPSSSSSSSTGSLRQPPGREAYRQHHPFEAELAKVAELTEEMGVDPVDAEEMFMVEHGLQKWSAREYEMEIWGGGVLAARGTYTLLRYFAEIIGTGTTTRAASIWAARKNRLRRESVPSPAFSPTEVDERVLGEQEQDEDEQEEGSREEKEEEKEENEGEKNGEKNGEGRTIMTWVVLRYGLFGFPDINIPVIAIARVTKQETGWTDSEPEWLDGVVVANYHGTLHLGFSASGSVPAEEIPQTAEEDEGEGRSSPSQTHP
ncbi:hypothetical protein EX30DRAFT_371152 [Ascodesmis nigricans]|uniref:Uncharacterized protein n=1 Tax=Ascodesmis nigricans TaxID=341454 RepID=A0A4S2MYU5_9PEZI|nr:hypothetical protein EX30DRAFT_371152 [Ascodesmis nigricans]